MANYRIADIEGIGPVYAKKLKGAKIQSVNGLLEKGATRKGRKEISNSTGLDESLILKWVNAADLYRVKGIGSEYSQLLEKAGVDTVKELRNRTPDNLHAKVLQVNSSHKLVRRPPSVKMVKAWISAAKRLKPIVTY